MTALLLFVSTYITVLALGVQSLNVNGGHRWLAAGTSLFIGTGNLVLLKTLPGDTTWVDVAAYLLGGPAGIVSAMALHPRLVQLYAKGARHG